MLRIKLGIDKAWKYVLVLVLYSMFVVKNEKTPYKIEKKAIYWPRGQYNVCYYLTSLFAIFSYNSLQIFVEFN